MEPGPGPDERAVVAHVGRQIAAGVGPVGRDAREPLVRPPGRAAVLRARHVLIRGGAEGLVAEVEPLGVGEAVAADPDLRQKVVESDRIVVHARRNAGRAVPRALGWRELGQPPATRAATCGRRGRANKLE